MSLKSGSSETIVREKPLKTVCAKLGLKWIYQICVDDPTSTLDGMAIGRGKDLYPTQAAAFDAGELVIRGLKAGMSPAPHITQSEIEGGPVVDVGKETN
jgi:hypothetical protein